MAKGAGAGPLARPCLRWCLRWILSRTLGRHQRRPTPRLAAIHGHWMAEPRCYQRAGASDMLFTRLPAFLVARSAPVPAPADPGARDQSSSQRRRTSEVLAPPKPKELDIATLIGARRASSGT